MSKGTYNPPVFTPFSILAVILTSMFVWLKVTDQLDWSWWAALSPAVYIPFRIVLVAVCITINDAIS